MKLEKFNYNDGKGKRMFLYGFILCAVLMILINLFFSQAKYLNTESVKIVEGTIKNYSPYDFKLLAVKLENENGEYESSDTIPSSGYTLNTIESYCTIPDGNENNEKDSSITINYHDGVVGFDNMTKKGTKCYLYFDIKTPTASEVILANMSIVTTRSSFSSTVTASSTGTIYTTEDDDGTSYYFSGNPTDNWVKFAGFYWRIIRINGDGTIRMIYQGTAANPTGTGTQTTTVAFNSPYNNNMHVGYMYTSGSVHGLGTSSTIKVVLDSWYENNLASYISYIDTNAGFCGDRTPSTSNSSSNGLGGTGTTKTYYGAYIRLYKSDSASNAAPSLKCPESSTDLYTLSSSSKGNKALGKPIGLITADEVSYAGGVYGINNSGYYLYTGQYYWTLSPYVYSGSGPYVCLVNSAGALSANYAYAYGVRPVINLRADAILIGSGTITDPYVVS